MSVVSGLGSLFLVLVGTVFVIHSCSGTDPGFRAAVTSKGLDYLNKIGIPLLKKELSKINIPDVSGKADIKIGKVKYNLKNIRLSQFEEDSSSLTSSAGKGLTLKATDISIKVTADWSYKTWFASDHGSVDGSASSISLTVSILVGATSSGQPNVTSTGCSFNVGHISVKLHGGASWLYNLFDGVFEKKIKSALNSKMCDLARNSINKGANKALSSLPAVIKIDQYAELSYALLQQPVFTSWFVLTNHRGEFLSVSQPNVQPPFTPSPLPPMPTTLDPNCSMVHLWATDYMVNTAALVYIRAGILHYNITSDMVGKLGPLFKLNTNTFSLLVPQLYHKYPNKNMTIGIRAMENKPPFISINPKGANLTVPMAIDFYVMDGDSMPLAFTLGVMASLDTEVLLEEDHKNNQLIVKGNAKSLSAFLSIVETNVGNFEISKIQGLFNILRNSVLLGQINKFANRGFPIPNVKNLRFINPSVRLGKGYVVIETDINYTVTDKNY